MTSFFLQNGNIEYICTCKALNPITKLYFCRHCLELRCGRCVSIEVDSHYCSNCLENIPSSEAKHKKNKCNSCFDCPSCHHTLSARGTTVSVPMTVKKEGETATDSPSEPKMITKKMFYLACLACRWTSRDAGIPDQTVAQGSWPELENTHIIRFQSLAEHAQAVVLQRKQEKQDYLKRRTQKPHKFPSLTDRTGLTASMIRRQVNWGEKTSQKIHVEKINPSIATDETTPLPESIFTDDINLKMITTIQQRLAQIQQQPITVTKLYPQHKSLCIKRSLRCKRCDHNVCKPELNPNSIKYRIQLFAAYHVPEVRLVECTNLKAGANCYVKLKFINPTMHDMTIVLYTVDINTEEGVLVGVEKANVNGKIQFTNEPFELLRRDDSIDIDEENIQREKDYPDFIVAKKGNQVTGHFPVSVSKEVKDGDEIRVGVTVKYLYTNTSSLAEKKEMLKQDLKLTAIVALGKYQG
ncbi:dynactin subunit 4 [Culicoides brevitarsis]|uniref:dynactin subunit 4 n=1 Tax=Culicoides brevitarsis TaxID=469753 RepID=UPI00307BB3D4